MTSDVTIESPEMATSSGMALPRRFSLAGCADAFVHVAFGILLISVLLSMVADWGWPFTLFCHFKLQYMLAAVFFALWFGIQTQLSRRVPLVVVCVLMFFINAFSVLPYALPYLNSSTPVTVSADKQLAVMSVNLWEYNTNRQAAIKAIEARNPDLLVVCEYDTHWKDAFNASPVIQTYAYQWTPSNLMIGIFSRRPLANTRLIQTIHPDGPLKDQPVRQGSFLTADVTVNNQPVTIVGIHPNVPSTPHRYASQVAFYQELAKARNQFAERLVVVGDFNTSPFSSYYQRLLRELKVKDSMRYSGYQVSWPTLFPFFYIALDHALISPNLTVLQRQTGPWTGSDHLPVTLTIAVPDET